MNLYREEVMLNVWLYSKFTTTLRMTHRIVDICISMSSKLKKSEAYVCTYVVDL